ncbi:MAG: hypothetical protein AAGJ83_14760, partial [Planctomycetota bacterium]
MSSIPEDLRRWEWQLLEMISQTPSQELIRSRDVKPFTYLEIARKRRRMFAACDDGMLWQWTLPSERSLFPRKGKPKFAAPRVLFDHPRPIQSLTVSSDERWLAWIDDSGVACCWDLEENELTQVIEPSYGGSGRCLAFSPDSRLLLLAGGTQKEESDATPLSSWCELLRFTGDRFSTSTGKAFRRRSGINSVRFLDNETFAWSRGGAPLSFDSAGYIELWKVDDDEIRNARTIWRGRNLYGLDYHPASQSLAWGDETGTVFVCDVTDTRQVAMAQGTHRPAVHVRFSPSGQELAVTSVDGEVTRWRVEITGVAKKGTDPEAPRVAATSAVNSANLKSNDAKSNQPKSDDLKTIDSKADEPAIVSNASKPKTTKTGVDPMPVSGPVRILLTHVKDCRGHDEAATATIFIRPDASKLDQTLGPRGYADHLISCGNDARVLLWSNQSHAQIDRTLLGRRQLVDAMWISPKQLAVTSYASIASKETLFRSALLSKHGLDVECRHVPGARSFASDAGPVQTIRSKTHPPRYLVPGRDAIWLCEYGNMKPIRRFSLPECLGQGVITAAAMVDSKYLVA